jgi:hypothetical protein
VSNFSAISWGEQVTFSWTWKSNLFSPWYSWKIALVKT